MRTSFSLMILIAVLLSACSVVPGSVAQPTPASAPTQTPAIPTPNDAPLLPPKAALEAQKALAQLMNVAVEDIKIFSLKEAQWPNGCLGLDTPAMTCLAVVTPGYQVLLDLADRRYEYRTDAEGALVLPAGLVIERMEEFAPIVQAYAGHINAAAADLKLLRVVPEQWPTPCLGYIHPAELCAQAVTPGYRVVIQHGDLVDEVHTDTALSRMRVTGGIEISLK